MGGGTCTRISKVTGSSAKASTMRAACSYARASRQSDSSAPAEWPHARCSAANRRAPSPPASAPFSSRLRSAACVMADPRRHGQRQQERIY